MAQMRDGGHDEAAIIADRQLNGWHVADFDFPTFHLSLVGKIMDRLTVRRLARESGMSFAQWRALSCLAMANGMTVKEVAGLAWVDKSEVSRAVAELEKMGLTTRIANPRDARTPILMCTRKGMALFREQQQKRAQFHREILQDFSAEEWQALDDSLLKMARRLHIMLEEEG